jgi:hypothetical protein
MKIWAAVLMRCSELGGMGQREEESLGLKLRVQKWRYDLNSAPSFLIKTWCGRKGGQEMLLVVFIGFTNVRL